MAKWIVSLRGTPGTARVSPDSKEEQSLQRSALQTLQNGAVGDTATAAMEKLLSSPDAGLKLLTALQDGRIASNLRQVIAQRAMNASQDSVRDLFSRFLADRESYLAKLGNNPDIDKLLATPGNVERGRKIFFTFNGGLCGKCHVIGDQGFESGPNLNLIGAKYHKAEILDNILHPSKSIVPGYETYIVRTKSEPSKPGDTYAGFLVSKTDSEVVLKDLFHKLIPIRADDIEKISIDPKSAMPEDLLTNLDMQQVADLLEFLASRK
jgi:putative heme-binding domain-containing protein